MNHRQFRGPRAAELFAPLIGTVLSVVMWAYTIYQVVMILIKLIWTCEQDEFELGAKRELKACTRVGACRGSRQGRRPSSNERWGSSPTMRIAPCPH
jgi:hypothetical protein